MLAHGYRKEDECLSLPQFGAEWTLLLLFFTLILEFDELLEKSNFWFMSTSRNDIKCLYNYENITLKTSLGWWSSEKKSMVRVEPESLI